MISDKQRKMLAFIEEFLKQHGYPPTLEEIRLGMAISTKSLVDYHLAALENAALLRRSPNTPRGIRLTRSSARPRLRSGSTPAALGLGLAELKTEDVMELAYGLVPESSDLFAFRVQNGSMPEALLNQGDILIMQRQKRAKNGDLVAVRLVDQNMVTFRRYFRENGHVRLQPDNPTAAAMLVKPDNIEVQGKVMAVIRQVE
jgi:repressor LexA